MKKHWIYFIGFFSLMMVIGWGIFQASLSQAGGTKAKSQQQSLTAYDYTDQLIVKYRNPSFARSASANISNAGMMISERVNAMSTRSGMELTHFRFMSGDGHVLKLPQRMTLAEATAVARKLAVDPGVEYAEPDRRMFPMIAPNDTYYHDQWHYMAPATEIGGVNLPAAWDITTGSASIVVAVIDTGILSNHADIVGRTVQGYDFITDVLIANDGDGRENDPSDPGDWITAAEDASGYFAGCGAENSSWHGTHVAGTIGASSNNGIGVAGINWTSKILPVRVLGKCGGYTTDIVDGMRWAAGLAVSGVPANANPAKVLNLSLAGSGACDLTWQAAINDVTAVGATVVVAAGNSNADAVSYTPASCTGLINVAATNRAGGRSFYSNYGTIVKIAAPGGAWSVLYDPNSILSTLNTGTTLPVADSYQYYQGTSMAAPHVSGIASLLLSVNSNLLPAQILSLVQSTARIFPTSTGSDCTTSTCGSGIIDAAAAVTLARDSKVLSADLYLALVSTTPTSPPLIVGSPFTHTVDVKNNGPASAQATIVAYTQSGTATIGTASGVPSTGTCTGASFVTCNLGALANGATATVTFTGTPITSGTISHKASVSSAMTDPGPSVNSWTFITTAENPVPAIISSSPASATAGGAAFTLTVNGSNFVSSSQVRWNGADRVTTFVSFTQLTATIPASDIATAGTAAVTVFNPIPVGGTSSTSTFTISAPVPAPASTPAPAGGGGGGGCFIATTAFGSPLAGQVEILRQFRDRYLLTNALGQQFVAWYYRNGPVAASYIEDNPSAKAAVRLTLYPLIGFSLLLISGYLPLVMIGLLLCALLFFRLRTKQPHI